MKQESQSTAGAAVHEWSRSLAQRSRSEETRLTAKSINAAYAPMIMAPKKSAESHAAAPCGSTASPSDTIASTVVLSQGGPISQCVIMRHWATMHTGLQYFSR